MMKSLNVVLIFIVVFFASCERTVNDTDGDTVKANLNGDGVFVINEGNYMAGNGTISFYSYSAGKIYNDIFSKANGRPLGDIPYSMEILKDKGYIVVNNSGNIEVVDKNSMHSLKTIGDLVSPRKILLIDSTKAYVSSLYSNSVTIIDLLTNSISGFINIRRSSESMILLGNKAYVSSWYSGKDVMIVNTISNNVIDSIEVAPEPESMVLDKNNKLWVLCNGGYARQNFAELIIINTLTDNIEKRFVFPSKSDSPSGLQINKTRDTLYYIESGIRKMGIQSLSLPVKTFNQTSGRIIYKLGIDPRNNRIFYSDALDYQQKGYILQLNSNGAAIDSSRADIIPGSFCFK
jgi:hypothetical protein